MYIYIYISFSNNGVVGWCKGSGIYVIHKIVIPEMMNSYAFRHRRLLRDLDTDIDYPGSYIGAVEGDSCSNQMRARKKNY